MTQLALFDVAAPPLPPISAPAPAPAPTSRSDAPYQQFDEAKARAIVFDACKAGGGWVRLRQLYKLTRMRPNKVSGLCRRLVRGCELEEATIHFGGAPGTPGFQGSTYAYRIYGEGAPTETSFVTSRK